MQWPTWNEVSRAEALDDVFRLLAQFFGGLAARGETLQNRFWIPRLFQRFAEFFGRRRWRRLAVGVEPSMIRHLFERSAAYHDKRADYLVGEACAKNRDAARRARAYARGHFDRRSCADLERTARQLFQLVQNIQNMRSGESRNVHRDRLHHDFFFLIGEMDPYLFLLGRDRSSIGIADGQVEKMWKEIDPASLAPQEVVA